MMATVPHVTSGSGLRKFQADGFLLDRVYIFSTKLDSVMKSYYHPNVTGSCVLPKKITTTTLLEGLNHDCLKYQNKIVAYL